MRTLIGNDGFELMVNPDDKKAELMEGDEVYATFIITSVKKDGAHVDIDEFIRSELQFTSVDATCHNVMLGRNIEFAVVCGAVQHIIRGSSV